MAVTMEEEDQHIFRRKSEDYKIRLNPNKEWGKQASCFISKNFDIPQNEALKYVRRAIKEKGVKNPIVKYDYRNIKGDKENKEDKLTDYLNNVLEEKEILAPSFTSYVHPTKAKSIHADFLSININKRKKDKAAAFKYKLAGDMENFLHYNTLQKVRKIFNNSLSGAYASKSTALYNPSAHYTLTSITRSVASIGNAITESVIAGNKHLRNPEITINYITSVISTVDMNSVEIVLNKYNLYKPTPQEVFDSLLYSFKYYWRDKRKEKTILNFLNRLTSVELAAVLYVNNLFHMKKYNDSFVRDMLGSISKKVPAGSTNYLYDIDNAPEGVMNLVHHVCMDDIKGMDVNYKTMQDLINDPNTKQEDIKKKTKKDIDLQQLESILRTLASTTKNITKQLQKYKNIFRTFFTTDIMPISVAYIKDMMRDSIVLSDTDSTCGSYDKWVEWYFGEPKFSSDAVALSATAMTINTMVMDHNIKLFAKNMNIEDNLVELLKMKNEFFWPIFTATNVSKHYFADTRIQEGNVYDESDIEIKGVHLIASSVNQEVVKEGKEMMDELHHTILEGKKVKLEKYIKRVADIERDIISRARNGSLAYYKNNKIKDKNSYKLGPEDSPYFNHTMWQDVFQDKYGNPGEPTYMVIKIPTIINSKKDFTNFIESIEDNSIKTKFKSFIDSSKKDILKTFNFPISIVSSTGMPDEVVEFIDYKRIVIDNCMMLYLILEAIGAYRKKGMLFKDMGY